MSTFKVSLSQIIFYPIQLFTNALKYINIVNSYRELSEQSYQRKTNQYKKNLSQVARSKLLSSVLFRPPMTYTRPCMTQQASPLRGMGKLRSFIQLRWEGRQHSTVINEFRRQPPTTYKACSLLKVTILINSSF